jgi:hypothetical protein
MSCACRDKNIDMDIRGFRVRIWSGELLTKVLQKPSLQQNISVNGREF